MSYLIFQVTPTYICSGWAKLDWAGFLEAWEMLGEGERRVGQLVGVDESFIVRAMKGAVNIQVRAIMDKTHKGRKLHNKVPV